MTLKHHSGEYDRIDQELHDIFQELARVERGVEAPPRVEEAVMRAWDAAHGVRDSSRPRSARWTAMGAVAASFVVASAVTLLRNGPPATDAPSPSLPPALSTPHGSSASITSVPEPRAVPRVPRRVRTRLTPGAPASPAPTTIVLVGGPVTAGEQVRVVRMRIARETLLSIGLRPLTPIDGDTVDVDMLIGEDGVARGLRVSM
jgi:hypothetical protein